MEELGEGEKEVGGRGPQIQEQKIQYTVHVHVPMHNSIH